MQSKIKIFLLLVLFHCIIFVLTSLAPAKDFTVVSGHPRIFINSSNLATLKNRAETTHSSTYAALKEWCDENWDNLPIQKKIFHGASTMVDAGALRYALIYALSEISGFSYSHTIREYGDQAVNIIMDRIKDFASYDNIQIVAITYDWVYDCLSPTQRRSIVDWFHTISGDSPTVSSPEMVRNGYRISSTPRCLYPALAFYGDGYKQETAETYLNFVKGPWFDDLNAVFHESGEDGGHAAGPEYAKYHYPTSFHIHQDFYALYTATTGTLDDFFCPYSYVSGFPIWLLNNIQPGPPSPTPYMSSAVVPLNKFGDMNSLGWNIHNTEIALGQTLQLLAQVAQQKGETDKAGVIKWLATDLLNISYPSTFEILFNDKGISPSSPDALGLPPCKAFGWKESGVIDSYLTNPKAGVGEIYMRSSWNGLGVASTNVTYASFKAPPYFYFGHQHYDALAFSIFKGEPLALSSSGAYWPKYEGGGIDYKLTEGSEVTVGFPHHWLYYERLGGNTLLIMDPNELIYTEPTQYSSDFYPKDGGQKKITEVVSFRWGAVEKNSVFDIGGLIKHEDTDNYTYSSGDATKAYNSIIDGKTYVGGQSDPKVSLVQRDFVYLKSDGGNNDYFVVFDRINSTDPTFRKVFLLHTVGEPVLNGDESKIYGGNDGGLYESNNTNSFKVTQNTAKMFMKTLLPSSTKVYKMGGTSSTTITKNIDNTSGLLAGGPKIDIKASSTAELPDKPIVVIDGTHDTWGPFKECFMCESKDDTTKMLRNCIRGKRYFKQNYPSTHPSGSTVTQYYAWMYRETDTGDWICHPLNYGIPNLTTDFVNDCDERGRWSLRIETTEDETHSNFLHVIHPTINMTEESMAETILIDLGNMAGCLIKDSSNPWVLIFLKTGSLQSSLTYQASYSGNGKHLITGLKKGVYDIYRDGVIINRRQTSNQNTLYFESNGGQTFQVAKSKTEGSGRDSSRNS